ncbi:MAG: SUMF1/EgtB/PvdO family nonheme iron enzyme [Prevotella sp.]|nr:SUMF1/EgtB/PvdO family nonheme iron enzyme [Prevotella sp.]
MTPSSLKAPRRNRFFLFVLAAVLLFIGGLYVIKNRSWIYGLTNVEQRLPDADDPVIKGLLADMVPIEGGTFVMGATLEDSPYIDELPPHEVHIGSFSLGRHEVTQAEWEVLMGANPSIEKGDDLPVSCVSWEECKRFINRLNRVTGRKFRFPTEQEWEYAAKKGMDGIPRQTADTLEWTMEVSGGKPHPVGKLSPNAMGLSDMGGNVSEWCDTTKLAYSDTLSHVYVRRKVVRGGNYSSDPWHARATYRMNEDKSIHSPLVGLRLAE